jgi:hypothetical protein
MNAKKPFPKNFGIASLVVISMLILNIFFTKNSIAFDKDINGVSGNIKFAKICSIGKSLSIFRIITEAKSETAKINSVDVKMYSAFNSSYTFFGIQLGNIFGPAWRQVKYIVSGGPSYWDTGNMINTSTVLSTDIPVQISQHVSTDKGTIVDLGGILDMGVILQGGCSVYDNGQRYIQSPT